MDAVLQEIRARQAIPLFNARYNLAVPNLLADFEVSDLFKPVIALIAVVIVLILAIQALRKWMSAANTAEAPAAGFSLGALRQLVKDGKMTPEEFDRAKAQIVAATQRATQREADTAAQRKTPPGALPPDLKAPTDPHP